MHAVNDSHLTLILQCDCYKVETAESPLISH